MWTKTNNENRRSFTASAVRVFVSGDAKLASDPAIGGGQRRELAELVPVKPELATNATAEHEKQQRHTTCQPREPANPRK